MLHEIMEIILNTCEICGEREYCAEDNCPIYLIKEKVVVMLGSNQDT